jgi:glucose-1-phosphate adenylyltransferase
MVCSGSIISGGHVERSILSPGVRVNSWAVVEDSILFEGVNIGRRARVRRAIIDKRVSVSEGMQIGFDPELDRARGFTVTEAGIVVIGRLQSVSDSVQPKALAGPHSRPGRPALVPAEPEVARSNGARSWPAPDANH